MSKIILGNVIGPQGKSAYDLAVENGYTGTADQWLESLKATASTYDFSNFRFIIPKDLYLIKDLPCALLTQNVCLPQFMDDDALKFEMALPSKISQGEETLEIVSPYAHPYTTRITARHTGYSYMYSKDINFHIKDLSELSEGKSPKILNIGDSLTASMLPAHLNYILEQLGMSPEFIGTMPCSTLSYGAGYGIQEYLTAKKGEGRASWRLLDFACAAKLTDGTPFYMDENFSMMNPSDKEFDFSHYMTEQGYSGVDYVTIQLGTNDISGYKYTEDVYAPTLSEYLGEDSEYYIIRLYKMLVDSILAYNPNIKIGISAPMVYNFGTFNGKALQWAEVLYDYFEGNYNYPNVYCLSCGMWQGNMSIHYLADNDKAGVVSKNTTYKVESTNVHVNSAGQLIHALPIAMWIANMI